MTLKKIKILNLFLKHNNILGSSSIILLDIFFLFFLLPFFKGKHHLKKLQKSQFQKLKWQNHKLTQNCKLT